MGSGFYRKKLLRSSDSLEFRSRMHYHAKRMGEDAFYNLRQSPEKLASFRKAVAREVYFMRKNGHYNS